MPLPPEAIQTAKRVFAELGYKVRTEDPAAAAALLKSLPSALMGELGQRLQVFRDKVAVLRPLAGAANAAQIKERLQEIAKDHGLCRNQADTAAVQQIIDTVTAPIVTEKIKAEVKQAPPAPKAKPQPARPAAAKTNGNGIGGFPGDRPLPPIADIPEWVSDRGVVSALKTAKASSYTMRGVTWFWPNRFAIGKLGLIGGLPDMGKGLICCDICACATNKHHPLPCNEGHALQGSVLYFTAEDDIEDTVVPRLAAAGADLDRIHIVKVMGYPNANGKERTFSMITDLPALEAKLDEIGDVMVVIIDPMSAYIGVGKANTSMTSDVRGFLTPLTDLATKKKVFILGIMHFNKKADVTNAMLRIADSLAYVAAARHVYVVVDDPETEDQRLFVKAKNNISTDKKALSYMTGARNVGTDPDTQKEIWAPHILWGAKHVVITANDAMQAEAGGNQSRYARREAKEFLEERLADGPVKQKTIVEDAEANGITKATLRRAKHELKIKSSKEKAANGDWMWELPEPGFKPRGDD